MPRLRAPRPRACFNSSTRPGSRPSRRRGRRSVMAAMPTRSPSRPRAAMRFRTPTCGARFSACATIRPPTEGELYVAHFLGASGAARLINRAGSNPNEAAAAVFPNAARANKSIFYDHQGQARSVAGVYRLLVGRYDVARATPSGPATHAVASNAAVGPPLVLAAAAMPAAASMRGTASAPTPPADARPLFSSLYSEGQSGPVSQFVRDLWTTRPVVAAALTGQAGYQAAPHVESGRGSPAAPAARAQGAPLDLFSDRPTDAKGLFGVGS